MYDNRFPPEWHAGSAEYVHRMPRSVRITRIVALSMAVIGIICTASAGWLFGGRSAVETSFAFVPSWLLGLVALAFGGAGNAVRIGAIALAVLNMLWTVPSITDGHPPGPLGAVGSVAMIVLLFRRDARDWFELGW